MSADPTVQRIYETISEWNMTALQQLELAGMLTRDGLDGVTAEVQTRLGVPDSVPVSVAGLTVKAGDRALGMTLDELSAAAELMLNSGVPGEARLRVTVGFGGQLRSLESRPL